MKYHTVMAVEKKETDENNCWQEYEVRKLTSS
jgi:hypothetical protein